jgi:lysophospholipase L1-like esterase
VRGFKNFCHALVVLAILAYGNHAWAVSFDRVVTLGDSLLDDENGGRSPVFAEHLAQRLSAPLTKLAMSGATSDSLIAEGQHTAAAAEFGPGDVAFLWIGGNDFIDNGTSIILGNFGFLNSLEANVDLILSTLDASGMDIVVLNLPDFAKVPGVIKGVPPLFLPQFTAAALEWRDRLDLLAASYGAAVVDIFVLFDDLKANPAMFALEGNIPVTAPTFGGIDSCPFCLFFDEIHPSSMAQGFIANEVMGVMNGFYDPGGLMPLITLSELELFGLIPIHITCAAARQVAEGQPAAVGYNVIPQSPDTVEATCQPTAESDLWFGYTANCDGAATMDASGSDYHTVLSVYDSCGGAELACDDDVEGTGAIVQLPVSTDQSYLIRLAGVGAANRYVLAVDCSESGNVPATSMWGMIVLFLAILAWGTLLINESNHPVCGQQIPLDPWSKHRT